MGSDVNRPGVRNRVAAGVLKNDRVEWLVALKELQHIGLFVPTDVDVSGGFLGKRPDRQEKRTSGVGNLKKSRRPAVHRYLGGLYRGDRAGKADGSDALC